MKTKTLNQFLLSIQYYIVGSIVISFSVYCVTQLKKCRNNYIWYLRYICCVLLLRYVMCCYASPGKLCFQQYNHDKRAKTIRTVSVYPLSMMHAQLDKSWQRMMYMLVYQMEILYYVYYQCFKRYGLYQTFVTDRWMEWQKYDF